MMDVRDRNAALRVHPGHSTQRGRPHGRAVIGVVTADDDVLVGLAFLGPIGADQTDIGVIGLGPAGCEEHVVQITRSQFSNFRRQRNSGDMGRFEERVVIGQFAHLTCGHVGQFIAAIADIHAPQTGHGIQNLFTVAVGQIDTFGARDHPRPFLTQRPIGGKRVEVVRRVQCLQLGRGHVIGDGGHRKPPAAAVGTHNMIKFFAVNRIAVA